ncbi:peptidase [Candidatus Endobugula sertula]|uniref:Peptidase n=1 Tax=Candidatus Endobugula sertula TaxID=62101 RepID=A0A1D2QM81_9GAMM|nr:peptidase [Candidatus Endobugula sertula]
MLFKLLLTGIILLSPFSTIALEIKSEWVQGGVIFGKTDPQNKIKFLGHPVRINAKGDFVVGLGRDAKPEVIMVETTPDGGIKSYSFKVRQRKYREQRINGVPKRTVNIPEKALPKIRQEMELTKAARRINSDNQSFLQTFQWPAHGIISGVYGSRRYYNGEPRRPHYGLDIAAPQGTPVKAPASGTITLVHDNMYFSGGTIIMDHGHGISSTFIHLHKVLVNKGDKVKQGQLIAEIGSTGRSTGPHLDWRMNWFNQRLDPQFLVDDMPSVK